MVIVGVDTDAKGSVAILDCRAAPILDIYPIPNRIKLLTSGTKRTETNYPALAAIMAELISLVPVGRVYLEDQWSRPAQDSGSTFTFGKTFGDIRTAVAAGFLGTGLTPDAVDEKIVYVHGGVWKHEMRLDSDKAKARDLADRLFPECKHAWKLTSKHTSAAEASLIALWGATKEGVRIRPGTIVKAVKKPILSVAQSLVYPRRKP